MATRKAAAFGGLTAALTEELTGYIQIPNKRADSLGIPRRRFYKAGTRLTKTTPTRSRRSVEQEAIQKLEYTAKSKGLLERRRRENVFSRQGNRKRPHSISDKVNAYIAAHPEEVANLKTKSGKISKRKVQQSAHYKSLQVTIRKAQAKYDRTGKGGRELLRALYDVYRDPSFLETLYQNYGEKYA